MPGVQIADLAGGALWGATAILGALVGRARTGKGAHLDISMTEGALALLAAELGNMDCGARPTRGKRDAQRRPRLLLGLRDGRRALPRRRCARAEVLDRAQHGDRSPAQRRRGHRQAGRAGEDARGELAAIFATKTAAEWDEILAKHDCCVEVDARDDRARRSPAPSCARGVLLDRWWRGRRSVPSGPHTARHADATPAHRRASVSTRKTVLAEYGFTAEQIAALG